MRVMVPSWTKEATNGSMSFSSVLNLQRSVSFVQCPGLQLGHLFSFTRSKCDVSLH